MEDTQQRKIEQRALSDIIEAFNKEVDLSEASSPEKIREKKYSERVFQDWAMSKIDFKTAQKYFEVRSMFYEIHRSEK